MSEDGSVSDSRLTVDVTRLNKFVKRPVHPVRSTHDTVASIGTVAKFFTKLDAKTGYRQIPTRGEDQDFTTFISPWGCFRFKRAAIGLVSSGTSTTSEATKFWAKYREPVRSWVDNVIVWDSSYEEHLRHVWDVIKLCDDNGITLNPKKCSFAAESVDFRGYTVGVSG